MSPFFGPKIGENQKKGLRCKISGFLVQMGLETKQNEKTRSSSQISGVMISHQKWRHSKWCHPEPTAPPPPPLGARAPWINFIVNYCSTRVLWYAKMLKESETEERIVFFVTFFSLVAFQFEGRAFWAPHWLRLCTVVYIKGLPKVGTNSLIAYPLITKLTFSSTR